MWGERVSRFAAEPGDMKIPPRRYYPSQPVRLQSRWLVQMVADCDGATWPVESRVWATSSREAVERAKAEFYAGLDAHQRARLPITIVAVVQEGV